ncbi:hypothetical protein, partial [Acinetobacter baumannii]|uniref:hypothetical protein n=1 Tax=Acinetobacter baumannii TaxID=470 RepID=UPI003CFD2E99
PPPPPKPKKKCGGIAQIVMIVVAIVVTIYTAGAAAGLMAGLGSSAFGVSAAFSAGLTAMSTSAVAAGIGAAVGSAASQLAGKAMGVVDSFSWKQVGISALTAAATAGVGGALSSAGGTVGTTGATATQSSWLSAAKTAINNGGWVAKGAISGVISYGSNYLANQVFGNNQSFSWASLGSSIVGSIAAAGIGAKGLLDGLGTTVSPYAYSLAGANAAAVIDDKWFGGSKPDYLNVSMAAIANAGVRQFGENADGWFADSNTNDLVANFNEEEFLRQEAIRSKTRPLYVADNSRNKDVISDYHPNQLPTISIRASQEGELMAGVIGDNLYIEDNSIKGELYTIKVEAEIPDTTTNTLDGARSFFQNRLQALEEWGNASVPFQYSWATPTINTGNPRLDRYYFQPINNAFNTVLNAGWNTLKLAGNTATMIGNSPTAAFSVVSGDYEASQQLYDDIFLSNPATVGVAGLTRASMTRLRVEKTLNAAAGTKRIPFHSQRGSIDLGFSSDIPAGSTTGEVLTASMPAPPKVYSPLKESLVPNVPYMELKASGKLNITVLKPKDIPSFRSGEFNRWFDERSSNEIAELYKIPALRGKIEDGLRGAGGKHEFMMVAEAPQWSQWGVNAKQVQEDFAISISALNEGGLAKGWKHATGLKGSKSPGSKTAHNELQKVIKASNSLDNFKTNMQPWAEKWINGGYNALPPGFHD